MTSVTSYRIFVFDFFGVICSEIAPFWLERYFSPDVAMKIKREIVGMADTGVISQDELFFKLGNLTGQPGSVVAQEWMEYIEIDWKLISLIDSLQKEYRIALLTNSPSPLVRGILEDFNLAGRFESILVSSELAVAKPDPRIYWKAVSELGVQPHDALMIDDNPNNVAGALAIGMGGHVYSGLFHLQELLSIG